MDFEPLPYACAKEWRCVADVPAAGGADPVVRYVDELHPTVIASLHGCYGLELGFERISESAFDRALTETYEHRGDGAAAISAGMAEAIDLTELGEELSDTHDLLGDAADAPVIRLINAILTEATRAGASDVHLETFENRVGVRFRVDGVLLDTVNPDRELARMLVSRVKVMARLDIAERRLPQDGRMAIRIAGRILDVRVSTLPTRHGERLVLRLLEKDESRDLDQLGQSEAQHREFRTWLARPHGVILVTGPTGSGKSTTLYAALKRLNNGSRNILTVEDPVEMDVDGIGQTQVNHKIDMTFARGLRAILRQDPDVVMVGEIRDPETAAIAVQASLTGHLVLSTLHTNTALGAIPRLIELGVEPFLLSTSLTGIMAQRLVRTLCPHCREERPADISERHFLDAHGRSATSLYEGAGCGRCNRSGYKGRTAIYDLVSVDAGLQRLVHRASTDARWQEEFDGADADNGLLLDGIDKACRGVTTLREAIRVAGAEAGAA